MSNNYWYAMRRGACVRIPLDLQMIFALFGLELELLAVAMARIYSDSLIH